MNFYYDPILGLQYTDLGVYLEIDVCTIPSDFNIEEFIDTWKSYEQQGLMWIDSSIDCQPFIKITDYNLN